MLILEVSLERKKGYKETIYAQKYSGSVIFTIISADELFKRRHKYILTRTN